MQANDKAVLVYSTFPSQEAAVAVGRELVDAGLAACANVIPGMTSIYRWKGERQEDAEVVMLVKTTPRAAGDVMQTILARHSYDNPAVLILPVADGASAFLDWIAAGSSGRLDAR